MNVVMTARSCSVWGGAYTVRIFVFISLLFRCHAQFSCLRDMDVTCPNCTAGPAYDKSSNCSTCVEPRLDPLKMCTECMEGMTPCYTGNFTFSAMFHSYKNPRRLCGECGVNGPMCCDTVDEMDTCTNNCALRLVFSVQPYNATALDVEFPRRGTESQSDNISVFPEGPNAFPIANRSNPFTAELSTWTERLQFYIVVYDFNPVLKGRFALDRFLIDLELGGVPNSITRQTYFGIYNISQFDLSFNIHCSENYYGPNCSKFCSEVGVFTCDSMGNKVCVNQSCSIGSDCQMCTITVSTTSSINKTTSTTSTNKTSTASSLSSSTLGGVIGGILAAILILILLAILLFFVCWQRRKKHKEHEVQHESTEVTNKPQNFDNPIYGDERVNNSDNNLFNEDQSASKTGTIGSGFEREVDNAIYGNEVKNNLYSVYSQPSNVTGKTVQATEIDGQDSFGNGQATDRLLRGPSWNGKPKVDQSPYAVLDGPLDYDVPNAVLNPTVHDSQPSAVTGQTKTHHFDNPIYGDESPNSNGMVDLPASLSGTTGGNYERQFDNVIYDNESNNVYDQPSHLDESIGVGNKKLKNALSHAPPSNTQHNTQPVTYATLNGPSDVYDVAHTSNDPYDVTHPPNDPYDVAHPPNGSYDVAHPPNEPYDMAHPLNNPYDVAHQPNDPYDVAHQPNDLYDVAHQPNDPYDVAHQPNDPYDVAHQPNNPYDVAHPPTGQPGEYSVANFPPTKPEMEIPVYSVVNKKK